MREALSGRDRPLLPRSTGLFILLPKRGSFLYVDFAVAFLTAGIVRGRALSDRQCLRAIYWRVKAAGQGQCVRIIRLHKAPDIALCPSSIRERPPAIADKAAVKRGEGEKQNIWRRLAVSAGSL